MNIKFIGPQIEKRYLQFGLDNTTATYQRLLEKYLEDLSLNIYFIYLDDILYFPKLLKNMLKNCKTNVDVSECKFETFT